ncbi:MAG: gamma carbonic anhydrase family protein [Bacillota bacterium]
MAVITFEGNEPEIKEACFIADDADVIGKVYLGKDSNVWFHSTIRGDIDSITIGEKTNIQDNCVIHVDAGSPVKVGNLVTVGHGVILHGCTVGDKCIIGMGSIIMNGAVIGDECIIGAGALIPEGKIIPPRSMVMGVPGKIVKQVTEEQAKGLTHGAEHYVKLGYEYRRKQGQA